MKALPPLNESILMAVAQLVDDAQTGRRDPSHEQIEFCIDQAGLKRFDPNRQGQVLGKAKRVRAVLSAALNDDVEAGQGFVGSLLSQIRGLGGFRSESTNFVSLDAIRNLQAAFSTEGFLLSDDGVLLPKVLDSLTGRALTEALRVYVRRAQKGATDAALLTGTSKDLLEATAAHVLVEVWNNANPPHNFPTLLGQAFAALGYKTSQDKPVPNETVQQAFQRAMFEAACAVNRMRNKQGTGHGHPWITTLTPSEAHAAVQTVGIVAGLLLDGLAGCQTKS